MESATLSPTTPDENPDRTKPTKTVRFAANILQRSHELKDLPSEDIPRLIRGLRHRVESGESFASVQDEAFTLACLSIRRTCGFDLHHVQILGASSMARHSISEMQTGEGKTLTAVLPAVLFSLAGRGVHVVTVNDYLADRDATELRPIYERLGLSVGCVTTDMEDEARRQAYSRDITYGTAKEMGFDYLRDRLRLGAELIHEETRKIFQEEGGLVQRNQFCAIVDEADSVLIDDARTPLLIGTAQPESPQRVALFRWCSRAIQKLESHKDYIADSKKRQVFLTDPGCRKVVLLGKPPLMEAVNMETIFENIERALEAYLFYQRDRHYTLHEDEVTIVDESTGRLMPGRKWQNGLHQAIEAKEHLPISSPTSDAARVTVQRFFQQYPQKCGMTGTASNAKREFRKTYRLGVQRIPTNCPCIRKGLPTRVFSTQEAKNQAVMKSLQELLQQGRAVLVGTPSVGASERLSAVLHEHQIDHEILNARYHEVEAQIVSRAGQLGAVTIATNMAGRGTDIKLSPEVQEAGGLHVIATEMHSSARIDRQLVGRCARQGDPGTFQFFLSMEDELLKNLPADRVNRIRKQASRASVGELPANWAKLFKRTQRFLERNHYKQRKQMMKHEKKQMETYRRIGLNPYLEATGG
ncbi:preprotein translocase subunit SecA [Rubinisphaera italica]|uniref:Protein translocase subunit SecA n=1 Tax=Rubinisphaera italica TaxID=2527969 RepID=A0A5C5XBN8_9PLAN|nr:translocase [Rubinisphaera italica]TWT59831.1 preprotein translocase subunit SecA [Rubinisphaera italica]